MKTKHGVFLFPIAHLTIGLELSYRNSKEIPFTTVLNSNGRAVAILLNRRLKKEKTQKKA